MMARGSVQLPSTLMVAEVNGVALIASTKASPPETCDTAAVRRDVRGGAVQRAGCSAVQ
jgi:hypothetical protein